MKPLSSHFKTTQRDAGSHRSQAQKSQLRRFRAPNTRDHKPAQAGAAPLTGAWVVLDSVTENPVSMNTVAAHLYFPKEFCFTLESEIPDTSPNLSPTLVCFFRSH